MPFDDVTQPNLQDPTHGGLVASRTADDLMYAFLKREAGGLAFSVGTLTATTGAVALPSGGGSEVMVQNDPASTVNVLVGNATSQPLVLTPGSNAVLAVTNANLVYVKSASSTATVNWAVRG